MPSHRILIADDDVDALRLVGLMLERKGYEIFAAASGHQALQKAIEKQPSLIILDVMMPDLDGYAVATHLRSHPATEHIPILMFTAKTAVTDKIAGFQAGVDDYLTKPIHPTELTSRVEALINRTQRTNQQSITSQAERGHIVSFLPCKGGVGNSTVTINTALELKNMHNDAKVIVAELKQGSGTLALQMDMAGAQGLSALLSQPLSALTKDLLRRNINTHSSGLHLLCCTSKPAGFGPAISKEYIRTILRYLDDDYDYVLLDLPANLTEPFIEALNQSQTIILSAEPNAFALDLSKEMIGCLDMMDVGMHKVSIVLIHRSEVSGSINRATVEKALQRELISSLPYVPDLAFDSAQHAEPITSIEPNSVYAQQIRRIVQIIAAD